MPHHTARRSGLHRATGLGDLEGNDALVQTLVHDPHVQMLVYNALAQTLVHALYRRGRTDQLCGRRRCGVQTRIPATERSSCELVQAGRGAGGAARRGAAVCPTVLLQARHATGPGPREIWIGNNALVLMLVHDAKLYRRLYMPCIVYMYRRGRTDQLVVYNASKSCYRALVSLTRPVYN